MLFFPTRSMFVLCIIQVPPVPESHQHERGIHRPRRARGSRLAHGVVSRHAVLHRKHQQAAAQLHSSPVVSIARLRLRKDLWLDLHRVKSEPTTARCMMSAAASCQSVSALCIAITSHRQCRVFVCARVCAYDASSHHRFGTRDHGLAATMHGPSVVRAPVRSPQDGGPVDVTITVDTTYPFSDTVTYTVVTAGSVSIRFPLLLRIPSWCTWCHLLLLTVTQCVNNLLRHLLLSTVTWW